MASSSSTPCPFLSAFVPSHKHLAILKPSISLSVSLIPITSISLSVSLSKRCPSLVVTNCSASTSSPSTEPHKSPSTVIFIKGLPLSTSEGRLEKACSQFGEVSGVKIVAEKKTKQSVGFAFVWFTSEEAALLAVKEMDGKFFDGRFVLVTMAEPGSRKVPRRATPYKFQYER